MKVGKHIGRLAALALLAGFCLAARPSSAAQEVPYWPSEREAKLQEVESLITGTMRKIATAHYLGRDEEADELLETLEALRKEEALLRQPPTRGPGPAESSALPR